MTQSGNSIDIPAGGPVPSGNRSAMGKWASVAALAFALSGCGFSSDNAKSGFASVSGNQVARDLPGKVDRTISDPTVGTVAMATGYRLRNGLIWPEVTSFAYAGIAPGYDVGSKVTGGGTASYAARYTYVAVDYETSLFGLSGNPRTSSGSIALTADFGTGTLTGSDSELTVDGSIRGGDLSGNVSVLYSPSTSPITGKLDGYIGDTGTIGAFHGSDRETAIAGGFVGTAN